MNRRAFLSILTAASVGLVLDPERLLWVPGQKTIFLPSVSTYVTKLECDDYLALIVQEGLKVLRQNLQMTTIFNRTYEENALCPRISIAVPSLKVPSEEL